MSIYEELCARLINDLQERVFIPVKVGETWDRKEIPYQQLLKNYCILAVPRQSLLAMYKTIPPIETIPTEEKVEWKKFVNEVFPGTTPSFRLDAVKVIYTIGYLQNN